MDKWKQELVEVVTGLLGHPSSTADLIILAVVALLTCVVGLRIASSVFGLKRTSWWAVICIFVVTSVAALFVVAAARIYLLGEGSPSGLRLGLQIGAAVVAVVVIGIPLQVLLQKANFLESISCLAATLIITALITAGASAAIQAVRTGGTQMLRASERTKQVDTETDGTAR